MKRGPMRLTGLSALMLIAALNTGCRTSTDDVHRWANTAQGPRKLVAVVSHDRYPMDLRLEAAMTLIAMEPRGGRRLGIQGNDEQPGLLEALAQMPPAGRNELIAALIPQILAEMQKPPPPPKAGQPAPSDPSVPYKDGVFALLTAEDGVFVPDPVVRQTLRAALASWVITHFTEHLDDASQMYGMEQVFRELKAEGVRALPDLMRPGAPKLDRMAELLADLGDTETRAKASTKLVQVALESNSQAWLKQKASAVEAANRVSKLSPTPQQFQAQLEQYQEEELLRVFSSMRKVGGKPSVDFLLAFAQDRAQSERRRSAALAALQGNLDRNNPAHAQQALAIASADDTPDTLRDVALQRVGEFPRPLVVERLYGLFSHNNWKVRWVSAELILKMSETQHLPEFMARLAKADHMSLTEPLRYGSLIANLEGTPAPAEIMDRYLSKTNPLPARLTALGYYYQVGTLSQFDKLEPYQNEPTPTPRCTENAKDCEWKCTVNSAKGAETREIETVGQFIEYCVKPAMEKRGSS